jgi:pimeloyl-ACP methyl ester carboxylesterase
MIVNNFLDINKKMFLIIGIVIIILTILGIALVTYIKYYKNPADQKLVKAGIIEKTAQIGDVIFNYATGPNNGSALLLLHAQTLDWYTYSEVLPKLSTKFRVFAVDYPGHGKTIYPVDYPMTAEQIGNDLANFIEIIIEEPVYITGNSSGGLLTAWLAANKPNLVKAIILEDPPLFTSEYPEIKRTIADRLFTASYNAVLDNNYGGNFLDYWIKNGTEFFRTYAGPFSQQLIRFAVSNYRGSNPGEPVEIAFLPIVVQEMLRGLNYYDPCFGAAFHKGTWNEGFDHAESLKKIQCPVLLIQANFEIMEDGVLNGAMSQEQVDRVVSLIKNCQYIKVNAGHVINLEIPDQFIRIIEWFFLDE